MSKDHTNIVLMKRAMDDMIQRIPSHQLGDVRGIMMGCYTNRTTGIHAHARATVKVVFHGSASDDMKDRD